ncbi:polysaccharide deacetylase family protein [Polyangium mundeleinium]|uniref:Polysaccharide deacetylase family protein n=1 Tax=Polyangium mundeleinium TaxID=2995306 RepID=A0ABT5EZC1_9BACT|nr:polysaccharide deacetylase family protein [Polyangium mundeleinium]MDC0746140.1 polysaccharide deacetylase family protein [Polyangium mundeleinium]
MRSEGATDTIRALLLGAFAVSAGLSAHATHVTPERHTPAGPAASRTLEACEEAPEIPFDLRPAYLTPDTIGLTFDDGPDLVNTPKVLDVLAREGVHATFFINTENWSSLSTNENARAIVRRIVEEGHALGNHTVHHWRLSSLSPERIEHEIASVEQTVREILGDEAPRLTLFRAPYGDPYVGGRRGRGYQKVAPIVARHAVHIGWNIAIADGRCPRGDAECVLSAVKRNLDRGFYGIILLHSTHAQTARALPAIIEEIRRRGMHFVSVEDVVRARFGRSSAELVDDPCKEG